MNAEVLKKIKVPEKYNGIEIMMHPGMPNVDKQNIDILSDKNIISKTREIELLATLDKNCLKGINDD